MVLVRIAFITLIVFQSLQGFAQTSGCKDPLANNYNPAATVNDGTCTYNTTNYTPPIKVSALNNILQETSGLEWDGKSLWSFNDGGGAAAIYRIDTTSNTILQTVTLGGATNIDWEDIAFDGVYFYIGDFGNNVNGARNNLKIYKFPISAIPDYVGNSAVTIPSASIEVINYSYSDQPTPLVPAAANTTKFDCEAMIVDEGKIHLFTKNWINNNSTHYVLDNSAGNHTATPVETLETSYLVTAADKAPGSKVIALLGYEPVFPGNHFMHLLSDYSANKYFNGNKRKISLQNSLFMGQSEGITFRTDTYGYISNERINNPLGTINPMLHSFNINAFVPSYVLPVILSNVRANEEGATVKIRWTARTESNISRYEIEKLVSGQTYAKVGSVQPTSSSSAAKEYSYTDTDTKDGFNFYRIKVIDKSGTTFYSEVVSVAINKTSRISIFPNPVIDGVVKINYTKMAKGIYTVSIYNKQGSKVYSSNMTIDNTPSTRSIELPKSLPAGLYSFVLSQLKGSVFSKEFMIKNSL